MRKAAVNTRGGFHASFAALAGDTEVRARYARTQIVSPAMRIRVRANGRQIVPRSTTLTYTNGVLSVGGSPYVAQTIELKAGVRAPRVGDFITVPSLTHSVFGRVAAVKRARTGAVFLTVKPAGLAQAYRDYHVAVSTSLAKAHPRLVQSGHAQQLSVSSVPFSCSVAGGASFPVTLDLSNTKVSFSLTGWPSPSIAFSLVSHPVFTAGIEVSGSLSCHLTTGSWITIPFGAVDVKLSPVIDLTVSGSLTAQFKWLPTIEYFFVRGAGDYDNIAAFTESHQFTVEAAAGVDLFVGMEADVDLGGRVGVGGQLGVDLTGTPAQGGHCLSFEGAVKAELDAHADVFVKNWSFTLAQGEFDHKNLGQVCASSSSSPPPGGGGGSGGGGGGASGGSGGGGSGGAGSTSSVTLAQGPAAPYGWRYDITLRNFAPNTQIPIACYVSGGSGAFYSFTLRTDAAGNAHTASYCYTGDGPGHWVVAAGVPSNQVQWGAGAKNPPPTPPPPQPSGPTRTEMSIISVPTFAVYHNASSPGSRIPARQPVQVSCKVYDATIASVSPDGYWYRIASSPWNNNYYAAANTFLNGDPVNGPYSRNTDFSVPDCNGGSSSSSTFPPASVDVSSPSNVRATLTTPTSFTLSWDPVPGATRYEIYLAGHGLSSTTSLEFNYGSAPCGDTFTPGVQAVTADGHTSAVSTVSVTTFTCPTGEPTPLPAPNGVTATYLPDDHVALSWNAVPGAGDYNVYLNGVRADSTTAVSYDFGVEDCGLTLSPGVQARAPGGQISTVSAITFSTPACPGQPTDTTPPSTPTALAVVFPSFDGFTLGWNPSTDDVGVAGYNVYLNGNQVATVAPGSTVPTLGSLGYIYTGLTCGTTYSLAVRAYDAAGNTSAQASISGSTIACPRPGVQAPTNVKATVAADNNVGLTWDPVPGASAYYIWLNGTEMLKFSGTSLGLGILTCGQTWTAGVQTIAADGVSVSTVTTTTFTTNACT